ncbi:MAG: D-alanyl-D-alanine carboxypeptidase family protein [[Eubacterium] sulci]|nr:D-alanyl-D-alanine carboxypeptidase family protein [[Eubacterium] sulci]
MIASAIGAVDSGVLEVTGRAQVAQTYASFAYDEGISPVVVNDMMKAGDLKDIRYLELATGLFDGAESSPLYSEIQTGGFTSSILPILSGNSVSASGGIRTKCTVDGKEKVVTLDPGELVCPEKKVVQDYTAFTKHPVWQVLAAVAGFWNDTIGSLIDVAGDFVSKITEPLTSFILKLPGIKQIANLSEDLIGQLVQWGMSYIFNIPDVGIDAPGNNNYEGLVGAQMTATADSLENGKAESGSGIGGKLLSDNELAMIATKTEQEDKEDFDQQPMLAKIFDPNLRNSVANQMLAIMPIGKKSAINFLAKTPALLLSPLMPNNRASAATNRLAVMKSMGIPWYGYTDPAVLKADPNTYTAETCKAYDDARKKSLERDRSTGYVVPVYKKSDPCALEEVIASLLANQAGDTDSKYYIKDPGEGSSKETSSSTGEAVGEPQLEEAQQDGWGGHSNGEIPDSELQALSFSPGNKMNKKAAAAMEEMNKAYKADNGSNLTINEAYRDCATQIRYRKELGKKAAPAPPCRSNHGWGLAADIEVGAFGSSTYNWLKANAHKYGYVHPAWAEPGGSNSEPWHWEYARKVN